MKKNFFRLAFIAIAMIISLSITNCALLDTISSGSSQPDPRTQPMPDPRIGRLAKPPTPRATGNTHTNSVGMRFTLVQPGTFKMGGADPALAGRGLEYEAEIVEYETSITRPYYIGITTVTERQWAAVMGTPVTDINSYFNAFAGRR